MVTGFFARGCLLGFCIAAPVGPIGVLCLRRSLTQGWLPGLVTGLGAATADALYGAVAGFGLTSISTFLVRQTFWLGLVGGLFLCRMGWGILRSEPRPIEAGGAPGAAGLAGAYCSTVLLTLSNPMTILSFVAAFAGLGLGVGVDFPAAAALVAGVWVGSAAWWLLLSAGAGWFRDRLRGGAGRWINRLSGLVILGFGVWLLGRLAFAGR